MQTCRESKIQSTATPPTSGRSSPGLPEIRKSLTESALAGRPPQRNRFLQLRPDRAYHDLEPPTSVPSAYASHARISADMRRSEDVSPAMSPGQSRRASVSVRKDGNDKMELLIDKGRLHVHGSGDDERGGLEGIAIYADNVRRSLVELNTFSTNTTRNLNDTYCQVRDNMDALQNIVLALKELAETSRDIHVGFESISHELESDITSQLDALGKFKGQQNTIEKLQNRIQRGRFRIEALAARVEVVRQRVEGWERADRAWQEKTRKKMRITWTVLSVMALVFAVLLVTVGYSRDMDTGGDNVETMPPSESRPCNASHLSDHLKGDDKTEAEAEAGTVTGTGTRTKAKAQAKTDAKLVWKRPADNVEWLRALDEL